MANNLEKLGPNVYEAYGNSVTRMTFPGDLLTFNKYGEYKAGQEKVEVPLGTRLVVHVPTTLIGYVRWEDNKPVDFRMGLLSEGFVPPKRDELGYLDQAQWETFENGGVKDPWQLSNQVVMTGVEDSDEVYTFTTSSKTGRSSFGEVSVAYGHHIRQAPDEYPVVELHRRSYHHRQFGEQRVAVFKIVYWVPAAPHVAALAKFMGNAAEQATSEIEAKPVKAKPTAAKTAATAARTPLKTTAKTTAMKATAAAKMARQPKGPVRI
jgi:hypothetical protein